MAGPLGSELDLSEERLAQGSLSDFGTLEQVRSWPVHEERIMVTGPQKPFDFPSEDRFPSTSAPLC